MARGKVVPGLDELRNIYKSNNRVQVFKFNDFRAFLGEAFDKAVPVGQGDMSDLVRQARSMPPVVDVEKYDGETDLVALANLCKLLQDRAGANPFFLAITAVSMEMKVHRTTVGRWLRLLAVDKVITRTLKGSTGTASEYLFGDPSQHSIPPDDLEMIHY